MSCRPLKVGSTLSAGWRRPSDAGSNILHLQYAVNGPRRYRNCGAIVHAVSLAPFVGQIP